MVVAGADMGIALQTGVITPDHQNNLAVGFQADDPVGHVNTGLFHRFRPFDIGRFVEAGHQLDDHRHLFAVLGRIDQIADDPGVGIGPIQGHLDDEDLRIGARFLEKAFHRGLERFVRVLQQHRFMLADDVKDIGLVDQQLRQVAGVVNRIVQVRPVDLPDLQQIAFRQNTGGLGDIELFVDSEFGGQFAAMDRQHAGGDLQPDDIGEFAVAQGRLDHRQQIVGLLFSMVRVGISDDAEKFAVLDNQAGKQIVEIVGDQFLEGQIVILAADFDKTRDSDTERDFDAVQMLDAGARFARGHEQVQREVGDKRERVSRVDALRGEQRKNLPREELIHLLFLLGTEFFVAQENDSLSGQEFVQLGIDSALLDQDFLGNRQAGVDLLLRQHAVYRQLLDPGPDLLLQAADTFHEKFIEVGADHGLEKDPFQQRDPFVQGLAQHPFVEGEPGQFPIQVPFGAVEIETDRRVGSLFFRRHGQAAPQAEVIVAGWKKCRFESSAFNGTG